ncbi:hypothetical protein PA27867_0273 [Cryobacterium arcticum]|uniref:Uncharacterized protein n=2 Tax=Cryobacterium arcticum TaxID=670052 RepID=A0A1B1BFA0_9MICO|nr:hypothetical protein PA27867_0273 [Cryobacterium arcticum]
MDVVNSPVLELSESRELLSSAVESVIRRKTSMLISMWVGIIAVAASLIVLGTLTLYQGGRLVFTCWVPNYGLEPRPDVADACTEAWRPYVLAPIWAMVPCLLAALSMIVGAQRPRLSWPIAGALIVAAGIVFALVQSA